VTPAAGAGGIRGLFGVNADAPVVVPAPGLQRRTLVSGERMLLVEFRVAKGSGVPPHSHHHEQVGYVASGRMEFTIGDAARVLGAGDAYVMPSNVVHSTRALEDSVVIDVFSPLREDYL
jgi:quercetin dioxygenase-like cupin family protein